MLLFRKKLTQINEWSISKKTNNGRVYETKIEDKEDYFDYGFDFDTNTNARFASISFNRLSKFKRLPFAYTKLNQRNQ